MLDEPERESGAGCLTKLLVVLATDVLLEASFPGELTVADTIDELIERRVLPGCYRARYGEDFLAIFYNTTELTRNALVSDLPFIPNTVAQLAALALFRAAERIIERPVPDDLSMAWATDPGLLARLAASRQRVRDELDALQAATLEDTDVARLFEVPDTATLGERPVDAEALGMWPWLRFENWLRPFGNPPRPRIAADGRAWPGRG